MLVPILIVTPAPGFGEMIRSTLLEVDEFRPVAASGQAEALAQARQVPFALAILDGDLLETPLAELGLALLDVLPDLRFVVIPPEEGLPEGLAHAFTPDGYLSKPFYLPDLVDVVWQALRGKPGAAPPLSTELPAADAGKTDEGHAGTEAPPSPAPAWLDDVTRAAQHLIRLSLEADAEAALITRRGQLWAYAGQLPQPAAQELAALVARAAPETVGPGNGEPNNGFRRIDLARFIRLESTGGEYMLYATGLSEDMLLAMAFDAEMPFSKIRKQAGRLARALAEPPEVDEKPLALDAPGGAGAECGATEQRDATTCPPPEVDEVEEEEIVPAVPLFQMESVPPPTPAQDWRNRVSSTAPTPASAGLTGERPASRVAGPVQAPAWDGRVAPVSPPGECEEPAGGVSPAVGLRKPHPPLAAQKMPQAQSFDAPQVERELPPLEPVSPALYSLKYACVLVPRLPNHYLTGELTARLAGWVRELSAAFAWRLEYLAIRPDYVLWISNVPPDTSPGYLVKIMRRHTSQRIFYDFPALAQENPSGDFWAPHYLVISTPQPPPALVVKEFVENTRSSFRHPPFSGVRSTPSER